MELKQMARQLTERGIRPTQQRLAVYGYLLQHRTHPSAEMVYTDLVKHYPSFSRTTVYNSLHTLVQAGLVRELSLGGEERRYDGGMELHGHFRCVCCEAILDIPLSEEAVSHIRPAGLDVEGQEISFSGRCPACIKLSAMS